MSVDLETKLTSQNFSQKTNEPICFSILMTWKYLKLKFWFQVSSIYIWAIKIERLDNFVSRSPDLYFDYSDRATSLCNKFKLILKPFITIKFQKNRNFAKNYESRQLFVNKLSWRKFRHRRFTNNFCIRLWRFHRKIQAMQSYHTAFWEAIICF